MLRFTRHDNGFGWGFFAPLLLLLLTGCWAPLRTCAIPASSLPDEFRTPRRTAGAPLNLASLTVPPPKDYLLDTGDVLSVTVPGLYDRSETSPLSVPIMANGSIQLPLVGPVEIAGLNLMAAQEKIQKAYADGYLKDPAISVTLGTPATVSVLVLGEVHSPGMHALPRYQNDVGHALAAAGGITPEAAEVLEVHRHGFPGGGVPGDYAEYVPFTEAPQWPLVGGQQAIQDCQSPVSQNVSKQIIPLRGWRTEVSREEVVLQQGDVVMVPSRRHEVFYVVGRLNQTNTVRFTVGERERELGVGFILPRDREIDVVTAVVMAGYIDPIDSPTTVTVHRSMPDGNPMLIHVDLIAARYNSKETVFVEPGDIIYLNPDNAWYFRHTVDRVLRDLIVVPYTRWWQ
jgi:polysaccharide export outer membrane protein